MDAGKSEQTPSSSDQVWLGAPNANSARYIPSGIYFARIRLGRKLIRKSLNTNVLSVAKLRLNDLEDQERKATNPGDLESKVRVTVEDAI